MAALCPGCLILFPEKISDLVWEQYVPIKGEGFDKAIQLLQGLGIVDKCKEEGWDDLSNKVLQTLRVPFQSLIPFQFQPGQQSRNEWTANSSVAPVAGLLVSENLFYNIKVYFENSCRNMILDDHGTLLTPNGAKLHNDLCNDFDSYCFTATMLIEKGLHVEFRRALFKASALVEQILRAEHPRTLACFLEVFIHLIQAGLPEVTSFLRDFIKRMSAKVIRKGHPWGQICRLLGELDSESLDEAMAKAWKCTTDIFDRELGIFSPLAVSVRLDYIKRVYGITNYLEEERLLRDLLAQFGGIPRLSTPRVMLNLAHNLNRQGRHYEAEEMALEVLSLLPGYEMYARRIVERIESLKIVSRSQFNQGKTLAAEQTMREAIRMIVDQWGMQHSWVPEFMNVLESWLRGWGREEDANTLRGEIEELMGRDEIDEQLDGRLLNASGTSYTLGHIRFGVRNEAVKVARSKIINYSRVNGATVANINPFFDRLDAPELENIPPERFYNTDKMGIGQGVEGDHWMIAEATGHIVLKKDVEKGQWITTLEGLTFKVNGSLTKTEVFGRTGALEHHLKGGPATLRR
ncbi:hypothetical protein NPX13_g11268 [Xylaria arbuscula]|uniref:Uncharacterized protein n=1 Tax=Xylaria arbuscula TaxID=114810 RepID=A0A9W8TH50_9PEZI|nr:hypothetical protein NPX13_g11268 [Xylaria arbuscula]